MLNIDIEYKRGILFVRLKGILNEKTSNELNATLEKIISKAGIKYLLINCEKLYSIDNSGIEVINEKCKKLMDNDGKVFICGFSEIVRLKIESSNLTTDIYETNNEISVFNIVNI